MGGGFGPEPPVVIVGIGEGEPGLGLAVEVLVGLHQGDADEGVQEEPAPREGVDHGGDRVLIDLGLLDGDCEAAEGLLGGLGLRTEVPLVEVPDALEGPRREGKLVELAEAAGVGLRGGGEDRRIVVPVGLEELGVHVDVGVLREQLVEVFHRGVIRGLLAISLVEGGGAPEGPLELPEGLQVGVVLGNCDMRVRKGAAPGIFTGTIIGMAQALGESAPLLLIGMIGYIATNMPTTIGEGLLAPNSAMPAQIYEWAKRADPAFVERAWGGIIILLIFLLTMNTMAVVLRRKFERRW